MTLKKKTTTKKTNIKEYALVLINIKQRIQKAQIKATMSANKELLKLYWDIGNMISIQQKEHSWGSSAVEKLAADIQKEFPGLSGFSRSNIFYMRSFYQTYEELQQVFKQKVQQAAGQLETLPIFNIPWFHNVILLQKLKDNEQRLWYAQKAIEHGWSRTILEMQIESKLYQRQGKAITNFHATLPKPDSDMAEQSLKDPYIFDFLTLHADHVEQELEQGLIDNVQKLLLELGKGFALVGRQYHLEVDAQDYYIDLLFYHVKLKCYFVVELKSRKFDVKDLGQLSFYLSAIDDTLKDKNDNPTLGLLLCKTKQKLTVEYALRNINRPIGVAEYETDLINKLPKNLKSNLPTIQEIEEELEKKEFLQKLKTKNMKKSPKKAIKDESNNTSPRKHGRTKRGR